MEILAPAGNLEIFKAAIQAGCDAVYISGKNFGARKFANNFTNEELIEAVNYAHLRNVFVYVTVNTIVYDSEWEELDNYLKFLNNIKVDALIVQDFGVLHFIRKNYPKLIIHASTQMNIHNVSGARKLLKLGVKRVVLARETPFDIVKEIIDTGIEVEIFGHGALCYSYSGQCLMSYNIGGRSGNRGECAQPCRKKYVLYENNNKISDSVSLISMKDLNTLDYVLKLKELGVTSLKIEGRMKSLSYVTNVVKIYKDHLNNISNNDDLKKLNLTFNREFVKGYLFNNPNHDMTNIYSVNHQGIKIGKVLRVNKYGVELLLDEDIEINDGIRIKSKKEIGFYVSKFTKKDNIYFIEGKFDVLPNDLVYKTVSNSLNKISENYLKQENYHISLKANLKIKYNEQICLSLSGLDKEVIVSGNLISEVANKPISIDRLREQLIKTDNSLLNIDEIEIDYDGKSFVRISDINQVRREALKEWINKYLNEYVMDKNIPYNNYEDSIYKNNYKVEFDFLVHTTEQYNWCIKHGYNNVYHYYLDNELKYINHFHTNTVNCNNNIVHNLGDYEPNSILSISNNIVNKETLEFLNQFNIKAAYLSNELNDEQIFKLAKNKVNYDLGVMIYGRSLMLVSKHCFISKLKNINKIKCHSCLKNNYYITDEYNNKMPVFSRCIDDPELIIYNFKRKNNINKINDYIKNNINRFLFVFTDESIDELNKLQNTLDMMR